MVVKIFEFVQRFLRVARLPSVENAAKFVVFVKFCDTRKMLVCPRKTCVNAVHIPDAIHGVMLHKCGRDLLH